MGGNHEGLVTDENLLNGSSIDGLHDPLEAEEKAQALYQRAFMQIQEEDNSYEMM
jgi:hypothetical protein